MRSRRWRAALHYENAAFNQLRHYGTLSYYSLKNGKEIDFILDGTAAFEIKESPTGPDGRALQALAQHAATSQARLVGRYAVPKFDTYIWGGEIR